MQSSLQDHSSSSTSFQQQQQQQQQQQLTSSQASSQLTSLASSKDSTQISSRVESSQISSQVSAQEESRLISAQASSSQSQPISTSTDGSRPISSSAAKPGDEEEDPFAFGERHLQQQLQQQQQGQKQQQQQQQQLPSTLPSPIVRELQPTQTGPLREGGEVTLTLQLAEGSAKAEDIVWSKDGVSLGESDKYNMAFHGSEARLTVHDLTPDDTGAYDARVSGLPASSSGVSTSSTRVEVAEAPVVLVKQLSVRSGDGPVAEGGQACLSACLSKPGVQVKWFRGTKEIEISDEKFHMVSEDGAHCLYINDLEMADEGQYRMVANGEEETLELKIAPVALALTKPLKPAEEK